MLPADVSPEMMLGVKTGVAEMACNVFLGAMLGFGMLFNRCFRVELLVAAFFSAFQAWRAVQRHVLCVRIADHKFYTTKLAWNLLSVLADMQVVLTFVEYHNFAESTRKLTREMDALFVVSQPSWCVKLGAALFALVLAVLLVVEGSFVMRPRPLVQELFGTIRTFVHRQAFPMLFHVNFDVALVEALEIANVAAKWSVVDFILVGLDLEFKILSLLGFVAFKSDSHDKL